MKILVCGKGGSGKSTVSALLAMAMRNRGKNVLLVDADESNIGLYRMLGLEVPDTLLDNLGGKKGFKDRTAVPGTTLTGPPLIFPVNMTMDRLPESTVASKAGIRVMSVGKISHFGEGCACPMGKLFRMLFSSLSLGPDDRVIVDTAAGVEHFGRRLDGQCDHLLCVVDPSYESVMMVKRVKAFAGEARLPVTVVFNRLTPEAEPELEAALVDADIVGRLPETRSIYLDNLKGLPLSAELPEIRSVCDAMEKQRT